MNIENGLITKVVETGDYHKAVRAKIVPDFFIGSGKAVWEYLLGYTQEYRKAPSAEVIQRKFPDWQPEVTDEPMQYFIDEIKNRTRYNLILKMMTEDLGPKMETRDIAGAQDVLFQLVRKLNTEVNVADDMVLGKATERLKELYKYKEANLGIDGIAYPWDALNDATSGAHGKELITVAAKSGVGKTWFELVIAEYIASEQEKNVLIISKEMDDLPLAVRMVAAGFEFPYEELRLGRLGEQQKQKYFEMLDSVEEQEWMNRVTISADSDSGDTLLAIQAKIEEYNPDFVIIDGAYLIEEKGESEWVKIKNITRGLKQMARRLDKPIMISTQLNRTVKKGQKADQDSIGFGSSFYNDSDVVIFLFQTEEQKEVKKMVVHADKVREGKGPTLLVNWDFDMMNFAVAGDITGMPIEGEEEDATVFNYS